MCAHTCALEYLSNQSRIGAICNVILPDVSVEPVAEVQEPVVQRE